MTMSGWHCETVFEMCNKYIHSALMRGWWVLLPDHLHCIWTLPPGDADFGIRWAMIKRNVTKPCRPDLQREG